MQWTALIAAMCSAAGFATSTALQHQAAGAAPAAVQGSGRLFRHLLRRPWWVAGQAVGLLSFGLHALALRSGALALVQPVVVSGVVFAVPVRAALDRRRPRTAELLAVAVSAIGLAAFLVVSRPTAGTHLPRGGWIAVVFTVGGVACAALTHCLGGRCRSGPQRASLYGVTSGILFGLVAGLLKLTVARVQDRGVVGLPTCWPAWALVLTGLAAVAVNQRAYRVGALSASMPILNIVDVLVALAFGVVVFREIPAHSLTAVPVELAALACAALGLRRLGTESNRVPARQPPTRSAAVTAASSPRSED
jgi:drug/metabolite transporter (DMT)-like permease